MNKKYLTFGLMGLFVMAMASAALVTYLSNTQEVSMSIRSPMQISGIVGDNLDNVYGGETASINFDVTNLANVDIDAKMEIVITSIGISKEDFQSINTELTEGSWSSGDFNALVVGVLIESVEVVGNKLIITTTTQPWQAGKDSWNVNSEFSFASNADGDYELSVTMIPA